MKRKLLKEDENNVYLKDIKIFEDPNNLKSSLNKTAWKILKLLNNKPLYPSKISEELNINEQKTYYHIKKLRENNLIKVEKEEKSHGGTCKYYKPTSKAFGIELPGKERKINSINTQIPDKIYKFFKEFIETGTFKGSIVVGDPSEHGPFLTSSRDGHYAIHLGTFLGKYVTLEKRFIAKLDTEVKAEEATNRHMILIGGPITNTITRDVNDQLKTKFDWENSWKIKSQKTGQTYREDNIGLIAKTYENNKARILISGLDFTGTKSCIIAITQYYQQILKDYKGKEIHKVIKGLDRDGDGKVDDIRILE